MGSLQGRASAAPRRSRRKRARGGGSADASECPPTYGARFTDVRGFVIGGWPTLRARCGDGGVAGMPVDEGHFLEHVLGSLPDDALVVFLCIGGVRWAGVRVCSL